MPCDDRSHDHIHSWPYNGHLFICDCETRCDFCSFDEESESATSNDGYISLRQHVKSVHLKSVFYAGITLDPPDNDKSGKNGCACERRASAKGELVNNENGEKHGDMQASTKKHSMDTRASSTKGDKAKRGSATELINPFRIHKPRMKRGHIPARGVCRYGLVQDKASQAASENSEPRRAQSEMALKSPMAQPGYAQAAFDQSDDEATIHYHGGDMQRDAAHASMQAFHKPDGLQPASCLLQGDHGLLKDFVGHNPTGAEAGDALVEPDRAITWQSSAAERPGYTEESLGLGLIKEYLDMTVTWARNRGERRTVLNLLLDAAERLCNESPART